MQLSDTMHITFSQKFLLILLQSIEHALRGLGSMPQKMYRA